MAAPDDLDTIERRKKIVQQDFRILLLAAQEHIQHCIGCVQLASGHHFGLAGPLENVMIQQSMEIAVGLNENSNILLEKLTKSPKEQGKFYTIVAIVIYVFIQLAEFIARLVFN